MSKAPATRRFAAFVESSGVYLVEYQKAGDRIDVLNRTDFPGDFRTGRDAAAAVGSLIRGQGGEGSSLSLTVRGLGTAHHILVLPQAKPELLRPVVAREMQRLYSDLENPVVDFVSGDPVDRRARARPDSGTPPQEILAAAMPRATMDEIVGELEEYSITLDHVTVLPRVLQRIYSEVPSRDAPTAVLMLLRGGPVLGFFFDRQLRLVVEPPSEAADGMPSAQFVLEQLERGNLYLRQQFRGAQISRLMLAAEPEEYGPLSRSVEEEMGLKVERFGSQIGSAGAIAAMGSVLDAQAGDGLNLLPVHESRKKSADRATRRIAVASAVLLGIVAWWWAGSGVLAVKNWRTRISELTIALDRRAAPIQPMKEIIRKRQESAAQLAAVQKVEAERAKLQQVLQSLSLASQADVSLASVNATRDAAGWTVSITGNASAYAASEAVSSVHRFYRAIPQMVPGSAVVLDQLTWPPPAATTEATTIAFGLHYTTAASDPQPSQ